MIAADDLRELVRAVFAAAGMSEEDAAIVAEPFVWANLRGVDSHGIMRVPSYLGLFETRESDPRAAVVVERVRPAALLVEANRAPGPLALTRAMREAIALARETGVAWATVRGTTLSGAIGYYTSLAAREGMAGVAIVAGVPNMAYHGARGPAVATNPLSIAVPAGRHAPLVLDMATGAIAAGKIAEYRHDGRPLPEGTAVTAEGEPTTDPDAAAMPLPLGGAKGSGMSLAFELLASGLAADPIVAEHHGGTPEGRRYRQNATLIVVDVAAFVPTGEFEEVVDRTLDAVTGLPPAGDDPVLYPGERGAETSARRSRDGIPLAPRAWEELTAVARSLGVAVPPTRRVTGAGR